MGRPHPARPSPADPNPAEPDLLAALASAADAIPAADAVVVVAHPDDETIGLGGQLPRLRGVTLVHVTDGAPRGAEAAAEHGFPDWQAYAAARRAELEAAMSLVGIEPAALIGLGIADQGTCHCFPDLARRLAALFAEHGTRTVLTHAYEGGHPDHDAVAFAVHAAARLLAAKGSQPEIVEMPFYHAGDHGWAVQVWAPGPGGEGITLALDEGQQALKRRMLAAHGSQAGVLRLMSTQTERFRRAPRHDFGLLPNGGRLLYERHGWGMTGARFQALAARALGELGLAR